MKCKLGAQYYCTIKRRSGECVQGHNINTRLMDRATGEKWWTKTEQLKLRKPSGAEYLDDDVKCCNCALCGKVLVAPQYSHRANGTPIVAGRHGDRPYCNKCLPCLTA